MNVTVSTAADVFVVRFFAVEIYIFIIERAGEIRGEGGGSFLFFLFFCSVSLSLSCL